MAINHPTLQYIFVTPRQVTDIGRGSRKAKGNGRRRDVEMQCNRWRDKGKGLLPPGVRLEARRCMVDWWLLRACVRACIRRDARRGGGHPYFRANPWAFPAHCLANTRTQRLRVRPMQQADPWGWGLVVRPGDDSDGRLVDATSGLASSDVAGSGRSAFTSSGPVNYLIRAKRIGTKLREQLASRGQCIDDDARTYQDFIMPIQVLTLNAIAYWPHPAYPRCRDVPIPNPKPSRTSSTLIMEPHLTVI